MSISKENLEKGAAGVAAIGAAVLIASHVEFNDPAASKVDPEQERVANSQEAQANDLQSGAAYEQMQNDNVVQIPSELQEKN